jgi:hypothetical protein
MPPFELVRDEDPVVPPAVEPAAGGLVGLASSDDAEGGGEGSGDVVSTTATGGGVALGTGAPLNVPEADWAAGAGPGAE